MYRNFFKRIFDVLASFGFILIFSPILIIVILLLAVFNNGYGIFFLQDRPGYNQKIFKIIKFKTMTDAKNESGELLPVSKRITKAGKIIRSLSLDELPQLFNVLKGDMSLIGPRPLLVQYLPLYSKVQARRHEVRPGITGWAQTHGRNTITWQQKFEYDVWYVDNISLKVDLKILFLTFKKVLFREDINASNDTTMITFNGNN